MRAQKCVLICNYEEYTNGSFRGTDVSNKSLNNITQSGWYTGNNIEELVPYIGTTWCRIFANTQTNGSASFLVASTHGDLYTVDRADLNNTRFTIKNLAIDIAKEINVYTQSDAITLNFDNNASYIVVLQAQGSQGYNGIGPVIFRLSIANGGHNIVRLYTSQGADLYNRINGLTATFGISFNSELVRYFSLHAKKITYA